MTCPEQQDRFRESGLAPYAEVVIWRRRFYLVLMAAIAAFLMLMLLCVSRQ